MKRFLEILRNNSSFVLALATIVLAIITFCYLLETRSLRKVAEQSFLINTSPKVFLKTISSTLQLNERMKVIVVTSVLKIVNTGKTEAKDLKGDYTISIGNAEIKEKFVPVEYLFPDQSATIKTKKFNIRLNEEQFGIAKKAEELGKLSSGSLKSANPIYFRLNLSYLNQIGERISYTFKYKYLFQSNQWVYGTK